MSWKSLDIGGFPSLLTLELADMFLLEELSNSYPSCLQSLTINGCGSLTEIPSFPSLTLLKLVKVDSKYVRLEPYLRSISSLREVYPELIQGDEQHGEDLSVKED
ncbi:hypothetical protein C5167_029916 [Papaver somniferum]|nr:hypothetical protein C5167_029916 [Papaver somniferum]